MALGLPQQSFHLNRRLKRILWVVRPKQTHSKNKDAAMQTNSETASHACTTTEGSCSLFTFLIWIRSGRERTFLDEFYSERTQGFCHDKANGLMDSWKWSQKDVKAYSFGSHTNFLTTKAITCKDSCKNSLRRQDSHAAGEAHVWKPCLSKSPKRFLSAHGWIRPCEQMFAQQTQLKRFRIGLRGILQFKWSNISSQLPHVLAKLNWKASRRLFHLNFWNWKCSPGAQLASAQTDPACPTLRKGTAKILRQKKTHSQKSNENTVLFILRSLPLHVRLLLRLSPTENPENSHVASTENLRCPCVVGWWGKWTGICGVISSGRLRLSKEMTSMMKKLLGSYCRVWNRILLSTLSSKTEESSVKVMCISSHQFSRTVEILSRIQERPRPSSRKIHPIFSKLKFGPTQFVQVRDVQAICRPSQRRSFQVEVGASWPPTRKKRFDLIWNIYLLTIKLYKFSRPFITRTLIQM